MEDIKQNDATRNRPLGTRPLDAPVLAVDLASYIQQIRDEDTWQKSDRNAITVYKTEFTTLTVVGLHKDAMIKPGNDETNGITIINVLKGLLTLDTEEGSIRIGNGQIIMLHEETSYKAIAEEETFFLLTLIMS